MIKIRFTDYEQFSKAKHLLVYSDQNSEVVKFDGYDLEITNKIKKVLDKNKVKYEIIYSKKQKIKKS